MKEAAILLEIRRAVSVLLPPWTREAAGIVVEMNATRRERLDDEDDLSEMIREVLGDVEHRIEHRQIASLDGTWLCELVAGETLQDSIDVAKRPLERAQQFRGRSAFSRCELSRAMPLERF